MRTVYLNAPVALYYEDDDLFRQLATVKRKIEAEAGLFIAQHYNSLVIPSGPVTVVFRHYSLAAIFKKILRYPLEGHILAQAELTGLYARQDAADLTQELSAERSEEEAYDLSAHYDETQPEASDRV